MSTENADSPPSAPPSALPADGAWQRARRPEQKAERRRAILEATLALVDESGVEGATLSEIARRAGLSKANCYRYFESREAILLELTLADSAAWMTDIEGCLAELAGSGDVDAVISLGSASCWRLVRWTGPRPRP